MNPENIRTMICAFPRCTARIAPYHDGYLHLDAWLEADHPACRDELQATRFMAVQGLLAAVIVEHPEYTPREWRRGLELALNPEHSDLFDKHGRSTASFDYKR
jgi:hypothetical protein